MKRFIALLLVFTMLFTSGGEFFASEGNLQDISVISSDAVELSTNEEEDEVGGMELEEVLTENVETTESEELIMEEIESTELVVEGGMESLNVTIEDTAKMSSATSGTFGKNDGFQWTYDKSTKTLSVTGKDTALRLGNEFDVETIEKVVFSNCEFTSNMEYLLNGMTSLKSVEFVNCDTSKVTNMSYMFLGCTQLTSLDLSSLDTSSVKKMNAMFYGCTNLKSLNLSGIGTAKVETMGSMFTKCSSLTSVDLSGLDTSSVTDMGEMFRDCTNLTNIDVSGFDTTNVIEMDGMFQNCTSLTSLDVSGLNTTKATKMERLFEGCTNLISLSVNGIDTSNIESMDYMFKGCSSLTSLDVSGFDTVNTKSMECMFQGCTSLTSLNVNGLDTSNVESMHSMFQSCTSLTSLDVSGFDTTNVIDFGSMFCDCSSLKNIDVSGFNTAKGRDIRSMFSGCTNLESLDVSNFDTSNIIDFGGMFRNCMSLTSLDVSNFDTSKATAFDSMFSGCSGLKNIDVSGFNTAKGRSMSAMFLGCSNLYNLDVSGFDTSKVSSMSFMFEDCSNLYNLDVSGFDTTNVIYFNKMFSGCSSLVHLDVSGFNTSKAETTYGMFRDCSRVDELEVSGFDTSNVTDMRDMFNNCSRIMSLDISGFDTTHVGAMDGMFYGCSGLKELDVSSFNTANVKSMKNMFRGCNKVSFLDLRSFEITTYKTDYMLNQCLSLSIIYTPKSISEGALISLPFSFYDENDQSVSILGPTDGEGKALTKKKGVRVYSIDYVLNGGKICEKNPTYYTNVSDRMVLNAPIREGHIFEGWYKDSKYSKRISEITSASKGDMVLYAKWKANKYTIIFKGNGATSGETKKITNCEYDKTYVLTSNGFKKNGYKFLGWNTAADGSGLSYTNKEKIKNLSTENGIVITLYAQWERIEYTITYECEGWHQNPTTYNVDSETIILSDPFREGHTFEGWYSDAKYKNKVTQITKGTTGNQTFYAKWKIYSYTIKFNPNGGSGKMSSIAMEYDKMAILTNNVYKKAGYIFTGWNTEKDGTGSSFTNMEEVVNLATSGIVTLYAQWKPVQYGITYELNAGDDDSVVNPNADTKSYNITTATITLAKPTRDNYTFAGWYSDAKFKKAVTQIKKGSTGNKTLYAKWTPNKYTIKFDKNDPAATGKMSNQKNLAFDKEYNLTKVGFSKKGYNFIGWNTQADGQGTSYTNKGVVKGLTTENGATVTLYAQWEEATYTITYNLNGGINGEGNPDDYQMDSETIRLTAPTKTGYTFAGWYSDAKFKNKASDTIKSGSTGNKTSYAKWTANKYTVKFDKNDPEATGKMKNQSMTYGKATALTSVGFKKTGYELAGWATEETKNAATIEEQVKHTNKEKVLNLTDVKNGVVTLYAVWKVADYDIIYKDCGTNHEDNPTSYLYGSTNTITLKEPTKEGYDFVGWYSDSKFKKKITSIDLTGKKANITVYAKWTAHEYTIEFDKNVDEDVVVTGTMKAMKDRSYGKSYALTANTYKRTGYKFLGWSVVPTGGELIKDKAKVSNLTKLVGKADETENVVVTLYAQWQRVEYTITYKTGGDVNPNQTTYNVDMGEDITLLNPTREGYTFKGWYTDKNFKKKVSTPAIKAGSTGNKTFYAKWTANKYTITFDKNLGEGQTTVSGTMKDVKNVSYGKTVTLANNTYKRTGYKFLGWSTSADGESGLIKNKAKVSNLTKQVGKADETENVVVTLYAQWDIIDYTITYKTNGGTLSEEVQTTYTVEDAFALEEPTMSGYDFVGWYSDAKGTKKVEEIQPGRTGNLTLYAVWKIVN